MPNLSVSPGFFQTSMKTMAARPSYSSDRDSMTGIIILHGMQALAPMSTMVTMPLMGTS